jgi:tRNA A37 threonylcarbamoyltransferase TsaD
LTTRDDAIGEAFDKVAKIVGLPYPGGPSIAAAAKKGDAYKYSLPKARLEPNKEMLDIRQKILEKAPQISHLTSNVSYDFSFSGLKTAVLRLAQAEIGEDFTFPSKDLSARLSEVQKNDIAASFQRTAIEIVVDKTIAAVREFQPASVVIAGGVAANQELRRRLTEALQSISDDRLAISQTLAKDDDRCSCSEQCSCNGHIDNGKSIANRQSLMANCKSISHDPLAISHTLAKDDDRCSCNGYIDNGQCIANRQSLMANGTSPMANGKPMVNGQWPMVNGFITTDIKLCTDNGAMIATLGCMMDDAGLTPADPYSLDINPGLTM